MMIPMITAITTSTHALVMTFETSMRIWVGSGSFPPRVLNRFWNTGTMKTIMAEKMTNITDRRRPGRSWPT